MFLLIHVIFILFYVNINFFIHYYIFYFMQKKVVNNTYSFILLH